MSDLQNIQPQNLLGQEEAEKVMLDAFNQNKLHSSWLISGIKGVGKATLAYKFARFLLDETSKATAISLTTNPSSTSNQLISNNSHPDFLYVERSYTDTDKKKVIKSIKDGNAMDEDALSGLKKSSVIKVDEVREMIDFLSKKSSFGGWRVVIVDSIDEVNSSAGNALLKILEEPPAKTIIMLISHNVQKLLPTIYSRCVKLELKPLAPNIVSSLLRRYCPSLEEEKIKSIADISTGSIGKALSYVEMNALQKYGELKKIIYAGAKVSLKDMLDWVNTATADDKNYNLACELIYRFISDNIASCSNIEELLKIWESAISTIKKTNSLNMDKKQALIIIIYSLCKIN